MTDIISLPWQAGDIYEIHETALNSSGHTGFLAENINELADHVQHHGVPKLFIMDFGWTSALTGSVSDKNILPLFDVPTIVVWDNFGGRLLKNFNVIWNMPIVDQYEERLPVLIKTFFDLQAKRPDAPVVETEFSAAYKATTLD